MTPRQSIAWGLVGGLSFLVLLQAYELLRGFRIDPVTKFGVAVLVTLGAAVLAHVAAPRFERNGSV